ncbi:MAG: hypothetical protein KDB80_11675 [Planctomycetes bacterium]|nr:hypothetical protein [Planctomycetota bacterium]
MTRALLLANHEVHWVTLDAARLTSSDDTLAAWIPAEVRVHGLGGPTLYSLPAAPNFFAKILRSLAFELPKRFATLDGHFEWTARLERKLVPIVRDHEIDAVLVCCGPHGQILPLRRLRKALPRVRVFVDYRDLLSGNPWNERANPRLNERVRERERRALGYADVLFLNTQVARERFETVMGNIDGLELDVMRNAADYELADSILAAESPLDFGPGFHLGFFGTLFPQRRLLEVLLAMRELDDARLRQTTLHCFIDRRQSPEILAADLAQVGSRVADRVVHREFVPYADALRSMRAMHGLVLVNSPDSRDSVFVPGKLYDYLMARRPVLFVGSPGDASHIVERCGGCAFEYGSARQIAATLTEWIDAPAPRLVDPVEEFDPQHTFAPLLDRLA